VRAEISCWNILQDTNGELEGMTACGSLVRVCKLKGYWQGDLMSRNCKAPCNLPALRVSSLVAE